MMKNRIIAGAITMALATVLSAGEGHAQTRPTPSEAMALPSIKTQEARIAEIGQRLAAAAAQAGWCSDVVPSVGWSLVDIGQFPKEMRLDARRQWQVPAGVSVFVAAVVPDGAAARAGITPGTGITSIGGRTPQRNTFSIASQHARDATDALMDRLLAEGPVTVGVLNGEGVRREVQLTGTPACKSRFHLMPANDEQAYADGEGVYVTSGMALRTTGKDDELAGVVAHEMAHNILRHLRRTEAAGTPMDYRRYLGRYTNISRSMEEEADRLSVWLLALAGYNPEAPIAFWNRFGPRNSGAGPMGRTHDRWQDRVAAIENELQAMRQAKSADANARPALLDRQRDTPVPGARPDISHQITS